MLKHHPILTGTVTLALATAVLTGCSSTPEENVSTACEASDAYAAALQSFQDTLSPDATVEEIRTARDEVRSTHDDLEEAAEDVAQDRMDELDSAEDGLNDAVEDLPDDATMSEAMDTLESQSSEVETARNAVAEELSC
ncbi:hypothetical protein [Citricoccus sp.]|jgi:hypothetical protein|uniref:hypothetical protein n=2 Tax=Citricoccus sp. TaxID=1978372 RepID=UPI0028BD8239|nr:hypothetical protein [Citricoccus sp.]